MPVFGKSFVAAQWEAHGVGSTNPSGQLMVLCPRILVGSSWCRVQESEWEAHGVVSKNPIGATKVFSNPMMMMYLTGWEELQGCHAQQEDSRGVTPSH